MGFGTEILFLAMLGLVVLGPKRMHSMIGFVGRAKAEFDKASREIKSQVSAELQRIPQDEKSASAEGAQTLKATLEARNARTGRAKAEFGKASREFDPLVQRDSNE
ncbi:MAG TPA: hypothetical protein VEI52_10605 [Terriglobales bacterium]|nr:hypothetical protein [Terriglobales bacterium]